MLWFRFAQLKGARGDAVHEWRELCVAQSMRLLTTTAATLLFASPHNPPIISRIRLSDDAWFFTSIRGDSGDVREVTLPALTAPLAAPLWVGETRELRLRSVLRAAQPLLASLRGNETFAFLTAASRDSFAGTIVTEAKLHRATWADGATLIERAEIVGVARYRISSMAGERPYLLLRGQRVPDETEEGPAADASSLLTSLLAERAKAEAAWEEASAYAKRIQAARLRSTLSSLGGAASAALLAIPQEDQMALRAASAAAGDGSGGADGGKASTRATRPLDEMLESGVSLMEELEAAASALNLPDKTGAGASAAAADGVGGVGGGDGGADAELAAEYRALIERAVSRHGLAPEGTDLWGEGPLDAETIASQAQAYEQAVQPEDERRPRGAAAVAYETSRLALLSHVALRLASGGEEGERVWAEKSKAGLARWERANGMLGAKRDALRVQAMMVDATTGGAEGE